MTANTPNRAYTYPTSTDNFRPYEDFQELATDIDTDVNQFFDHPICHCVQTVAQTGWTSATYTAITFTTEVTDIAAIHDNSSLTNRFVIGKRLGWWKVSGLYVPASNAAITAKRAVLRKNGTEINGSFDGDVAASNATIVAQGTPTIFVQATVITDYIELMGYETAASGTIGTAVSGSAASSITLEWSRFA